MVRWSPNAKQQGWKAKDLKKHHNEPVCVKAKELIFASFLSAWL